VTWYESLIEQKETNDSNDLEDESDANGSRKNNKNTTFLQRKDGNRRGAQARMSSESNETAKMRRERRRERVREKA
jgi:hypothetical protein